MGEESQPEQVPGPRGRKGERGKEGREGPAGSDASPEDNDLLLEQLRRVGSDLHFRKMTRRRMILIGVFTVLSFISSIVSVVTLISVLDYQNTACQRDNTFRKAYVDQWTPIIADNPLPPPPADDASQEEKEAYARQKRSTEFFVNSLSTDFAQHSC